MFHIFLHEYDAQFLSGIGQLYDQKLCVTKFIKEITEAVHSVNLPVIEMNWSRSRHYTVPVHVWQCCPLACISIHLVGDGHLNWVWPLTFWILSQLNDIVKVISVLLIEPSLDVHVYSTSNVVIKLLQVYMVTWTLTLWIISYVIFIRNSVN